VAYSAIVQNVRGIVNPEFLLTQVVYSGDLKLLAIFRDEIFNFSVIIFDYFMQTLRNNGC
jgi:hypothetical protein